MVALLSVGTGDAENAAVKILANMLADDDNKARLIWRLLHAPSAHDPSALRIRLAVRIVGRMRAATFPGSKRHFRA